MIGLLQYSFDVEDSVVLDLFAGTGAMAMEALSRGARSALLVENNNKALNLIKRNIRSCGYENKAVVVKWNIVKDLMCLTHHNPTFDIVFMDPPYNRGYVEMVLLSLKKSVPLSQSFLLVVEHSKNELIENNIYGFILFDQRKYGKRLVSFFH